MKDIFTENRCKCIDKHTKYMTYKCDRKLLINLSQHFIQTPEFQRNIKDDKINSIFKESNDNEYWFGTHGNIILGVIEKDDKKLLYYILDGQHRLGALKMCKNDFDVNIQLVFFESISNMKDFFKSINQNSNFEIEYQVSEDDYIQDIKVYIKKQLESIYPKAFCKNTRTETTGNRYNINEFVNKLNNQIIKEFYQGNEKDFDNGKYLFDIIDDEINKEAQKIYDKLENKKLYYNESDHAVFDYDFILALKNVKWIDNLLNPEEKIIFEKIREKRQTITKRLSNAVWNKYIGRDKANGQCFDCKRVINVQHFECGHLKSHKNGGTTDLDNLRPFCSECNRLLGSANFTEKSRKPNVDENVMKEVEKKLNKEEDYDLEDETDFKQSNIKNIKKKQPKKAKNDI
jgi:5-methylcytosine-specific restriction endonuclease McrA